MNVSKNNFSIFSKISIGDVTPCLMPGIHFGFTSVDQKSPRHITYTIILSQTLSTTYEQPTVYLPTYYQPTYYLPTYNQYTYYLPTYNQYTYYLPS